MKKGEIEIQFNWILILVAGALIFLFFFSIAKWVRDNSARTSAIKLSNYLDSIFTGSAVTQHTVNVIDFPGEMIEFECNSYRVNNYDRGVDINNKIIFAPTSIESSQLLTWSLSWDVPFRSVDFLFISSPQIRYIFIGNGWLFDDLKDLFPEDLNAEFYDSNSVPPIKDLNNYKVRIIYVDSTKKDPHISTLKKMSAEDVTALEIDSTLDTINFYRKSHPSTPPSYKFYSTQTSSFNYFGQASLIAAIFSENPDDYICNMEKAAKRLVHIAQIYQNRSAYLQSYYQMKGDFDCESAHAADFNSLISAANSNNFALLKTYAKSIEDKNTNAQKNSCALIY